MTNPSTRLAREVVGDAPGRGRDRGGARAGLPQRAAVVRGVRRRRSGSAAAAHPDRRTYRRLPRARTGQDRRARGGDLHVRHGGRQPAPGRPRGGPCRRTAGRRDRRPAGPAARHQRQPDHRPGRDLRSRRAVPRPECRPCRPCRPCPNCRWPTWPPPVPARATSTSSSTIPSCRPTAGPPTPRAGRSGPASGQLWPREPSLRAPGQWWSRVTTPARRRESWPRRANWPLFAEPTSGSRTGDNALRCYRLLLDGDLGREIERVIVFGHPTLSRPVTRLLGRDDVEVWSAATKGWWTRRPFHVDEQFERAEPERPDDPGWLDRWRDADRDVARRLDALLDSERALTPHRVAGAVAAALPAHGLLFVGASSPVRDLDLMVPRYEVGAHRKVIANRGLSGIDGTISSADRCRPRQAEQHPQLRADGRRDLPARRQRPGPRPGRGPARPDDRGRQRRRRLDLRDARTGLRAVRRPLRPALRHPAPRRPRQPLRGHRHAALARRLPRRAPARAGQPQRRHRGRRGRRTPRQPPRPRRPDPRPSAACRCEQVRATGCAHRGRVVQLVQVPTVSTSTGHPCDRAKATSSAYVSPNAR